MKELLLLLGFMALIGYAVTLANQLDTGERKLTLIGRLWSVPEETKSEDNHRFFTDPEGDNETIELNTLMGGLNHLWLKGSEGRRVEITIRVLRD